MTGSNLPGLDRRGFLSLGVGALVVAALPLSARRRRVTRRALPVMGTIADIAVVHRGSMLARGAIDAALAELRRVERMMTRFDPRSDVGRVNHSAVKVPVHVSEETAFVVDEALRWAESSNGIFDPAVGGAVELWDVMNRHEPPPEERIAGLAGRALYRTIEVVRGRHRAAIARHDERARIDLGGIAKGYGVDRAVSVLREWGIDNAVVDVGGDLYALGDGGDGDGWRIGIQSPHDTRALAHVFTMTNAAVATSGTYRQFFRWRGHRYHHLLDPVTATPRVTSVVSLTIRAESCLHADVAATTCLGMSRGAAAELLEERAPQGRVLSVI